LKLRGLPLKPRRENFYSFLLPSERRLQLRNICLLFLDFFVLF
jgi:hypothetical protein